MAKDPGILEERLIPLKGAKVSSADADRFNEHRCFPWFGFAGWTRVHKTEVARPLEHNCFYTTLPNCILRDPQRQRDPLAEPFNRRYPSGRNF